MTERVKILFLGANPASTARLRLDEEARSIEQKIREAKYRDGFQFIVQGAVRPEDLPGALLWYQPHVVHFSGHGNAGEALLLVGDHGQSQSVGKAALANLFRTLRDNIRIVVLNACYAQSQAEAIAESIDCVVGMRRAIGDRAAICFASSFYRGLAYGRSVRTAFDLGVSALQLEGIGEADVPDLLVRGGVDPESLVLIPAPGSSNQPPPPSPPPSPPPYSQNKESALMELLQDAFSVSGLLQWVRRHLGKEIHDELPHHVSLVELVFETVLAIQRYGLADQRFFACLYQARPRLVERIRQVAALWGIPYP